MNTEIVKVVDWLKINKLSLNLKKTHFIIFRKSRQKLNLENELFIDGIKIEMKTHTKFLGVLIDQHLTFEEHCKFIKGKIARGIGILYKGKKYLNQKSLLNMYYAFIYPYFTYCITVWGNTFSYILDPLMKLQKRALRLVDGARKYDHTAPIFEKYELLNLRNLYIYIAHKYSSINTTKKFYQKYSLIFSKWTMLSMSIIQDKKNISMCLFANQCRSQNVWNALVWKFTTIWSNTWSTIVLLSRLNMFWKGIYYEMIWPCCL